MNALEPIHITESQRLIELENTIQRGQRQWLEVGLALTEIRDKRLYRAEYGTFNAYCQAKWGWTDKRAYQLCAAAEEQSSTSCRTFANENEARKSRKERITKSSPPTSAESRVSPAVDADAEESDRSSDTGGESHIRTATEEFAETSTQEGSEENQNQAVASQHPAQPHRCDWTVKDFTAELDGLMERAEHQITDSRSASECLLALQIATKLMQKHRNALKMEGK